MSTSGPSSPRFTHIALPVHDLRASLDWYRRWTPLAVLHERHDDAGDRTAWIGHPTDPEIASHPFVLVLIEKATNTGAPIPVLAPLAHLGFEMPTRAAVDEVARTAREAGILHWDAADLGAPVGYVCAVLDPDGNVVEFSHDQGVYAAAQTSDTPPANV